VATFAERLRFLREEKRLSQYEMARLRKMPRSTYANYETGLREPDLEMQKWFADFFGVSLDYLSGRTDARDPIPAETMPLRLRRLREQAGLSRHGLAERSEVAVEVIVSCEDEGIEPRGYDLVRLAGALGVSTAYLHCRTDDPTIKDHLPPDWEKVVEEALKTGLSPDDVRRAMRMLRVALGKEDQERS
jgi:transcriptional regulator with XRE-family HTH domain